MSLPINAKFEVPKHKAPAPTRTSLWPALAPAPTGKASASASPSTAAAGSVIRPGSAASGGKGMPGRAGEGGRALRPITSGDGPMSVGPADGRPRRNRAHKRSTLVKLAIPVVPAFLLAATLGLGCANEKAASKPVGVMDVGGQPAAPATPSPAPVAAATPAREPVPAFKRDAAAKADASKADPAKSAAKPVAGKSIAATPAAAPAAAEGADPAAAPQTYVVQKGDTLTKIAREKYGDGNKWKRIAEANPGLSPSTIKVGQKLVIPVL